jgi:hypothetical protein
MALCGSAKRNLTLGFITAKLNWENSVVVPNGPTFTSMSTQTVERDSEFYEMLDRSLPRFNETLQLPS